MLDVLSIALFIGAVWFLFNGNMLYLRYFHHRKWYQGLWHLLVWRGRQTQDVLFPWWERPDPYPEKMIGHRQVNDNTREAVFWKPRTRRQRLRIFLEDLGLLERKRNVRQEAD